MNILHLISGRGPTGPAAAAILDVKALIAAGHRAWIATRDGTPLMQACTADGVPAIGGLRLGRGAMRVLRLPGDVRRLRDIVREFNIDTIHVHRTDDQILASAALGRTLTCRLVRTWHRDPANGSRLLLSRLLRSLDGCVCVSRHAETVLKSAGARQAQFIHATVDTSIFTPLPHSPLESEAAPLIGQVGRFKREPDGRDRGQLAALDVFALLPRELRWRGALIGRGEMEAELNTEAFERRRLPRERVSIQSVPAQSARAFAALLGTLSIGLVFQTGSDGTSRAAVELLACGTPLIVADLPGLRELTEESGANGEPPCVVRLLPGDPHGWSRRLEQLLQDTPALAAMRTSARRRAEQTHALPIRGAALAAFYSQL